jgi:hypothetical protein
LLVSRLGDRSGRRTDLLDHFDALLRRGGIIDCVESLGLKHEKQISDNF